ncbi:MAG: SagB/ThcOx family dehydrogenase [Acidobacteria bacterium]|nr:SagB/ThcOx family dehydrogenase [Acidobacteriota bacterium]
MSHTNIQAAWDYHRETKHSYHSVHASRHTLDWANMPIPFKIYTELEPIGLPRPWQESEMTALSAVSGMTVYTEGERIPSLKDIARLVYFSAGVTKRKLYPGGEILFRAASCTGALYQVELYLVCEDLPELPAGVYHFGPKDFALRRLRRGDYRAVLAHASNQEPSILQAPLIIVCTGIYWRNAWKYQARAYRHFGWDNGTILANLFAVCAALGLPGQLVLGFVDDDVNRLLDLNTQQEVALCMASIGRTQPHVSRSSPAVEPLRLKTAPYSNHEVDYPEMRAMHAATCLATVEEVGHWRGPAPCKELQASHGSLCKLHPDLSAEVSCDNVERVVMRRGSSRQFQRKPISLREFSNLLYCSAQGIAADFLQPPSALLNDWYLIVHAVEGLAPGVYVLRRETWELELLKGGNFRSEAGYLALEQKLAADASADVFFLADLQTILERYGNRGYRAVELEAGVLGGKLYLTAYAQKLGATGLTFYDDEVTEFFSPHARGKSAIFLVALGHGAKRKSLDVEL